MHEDILAIPLLAKQEQKLTSIFSFRTVRSAYPTEVTTFPFKITECYYEGPLNIVFLSRGFCITISFMFSI